MGRIGKRVLSWSAIKNEGLKGVVMNLVGVIRD